MKFVAKYHQNLLIFVCISVFSSLPVHQADGQGMSAAGNSLGTPPLATLTGLAGRQDPWCVYWPDNMDQDTKQIVLISGDDEYRSEEALPMLGKILAKHHGFRCTVLFAIDEKTGEITPNHQTNIPGMHLLQQADLVILALRFRRLPDEQMQPFADYLQAGKPIIGLRTSTHAFNFPKDSDSRFKKFSFNSREWDGGFGRQVLGETWISHHGKHNQQSTRGVINEEFESHPILRAVTDVWGPTDVYGVRSLPDNAQVLVYGQVLEGMQPDDQPVDGPQNAPMMPLAWIRQYESESGKSSRVFCTTMGSSTDFQSAGLRRLVVNASYWALGMEDQIPMESQVDYVDPYQPTDFGFKAFRVGMKPADYDLKN